METEKPLHVRVAEALGPPRGHDNEELWGCSDCGERVSKRNPVCLPHYDESWSATGPLIEKYGIELGVPNWVTLTDEARRLPRGWYARSGSDYEHGASPLIAVCNLILAMHAAGKLKAA